MIEYRTLTRRDAEVWQQAHPANPDDPLTDMHLDYFTRYATHELVALLALDLDKIVGRILLAHSWILVDGAPRRFVIGQNLLVDSAYRRQAVGIQILARVLKLGLPYVAASVSGEMAKIFDSWRGFSKVDGTPVYAMGVDVVGVVRMARLALQRELSAGSKASLISPARAILSRSSNALWLRTNRPRGFKLLSVAQALSVLETVTRRASFRVQVPWSRDKLASALRDTDDGCRALVFTDVQSPEAYARLLTLYFRSTEVSGLSSRDIRQVRVAYLNEVFPPLEDVAAARYALHVATCEARRRGASLLFVCATTPALEAACGRLDLISHKSVYVTAIGLESEVASVVLDPANWWCRAVNEDQFEESYSLQDPVGVLV